MKASNPMLRVVKRSASKAFGLIKALKAPQEQPVKQFTQWKMIGQGGCGIVFSARDTVRKTSVAIKYARFIGDVTLEEKQTIVGELMFEVDIQDYCVHKNVLKVVDCFFETLVDSCVVMPLAKFDAHVLAKKGMSTSAMAYILERTLKGIKHMHKLSVIHRDIKGENIMVMPNGEIKICDFGFATPHVNTVINKELCGTPGYMDEYVPLFGWALTSDCKSVGSLAMEFLFGGKLSFPVMTKSCDDMTDKEAWELNKEIIYLSLVKLDTLYQTHNQLRHFVSTCMSPNATAKELLGHEFLSIRLRNKKEFRMWCGEALA